MTTKNNHSKHVAEYGPRPTDAEVKEALAQGLPNPRWKRQNLINQARIKENVREATIFAQQLANAERGRNFKPKTQAELGKEKDQARILEQQRANYDAAINFKPSQPKEPKDGQS